LANQVSHLSLSGFGEAAVEGPLISVLASSFLDIIVSKLVRDDLIPDSQSHAHLT
jgi:hypothetical protein